MELALDRGGEQPEYARVKKPLKDNQDQPIRIASDNPILDTRMYEVEYQDGHTAALAANLIAENHFCQVDEEGNHSVLFDEIVDVRIDGTQVLQQDAFVTMSSGTQRGGTMTKGWELNLIWKDGSTTLNKLKNIKDLYPVQLDEYAVDNRISEGPTFAWWVRFVLRKRDRIISKTHMYWLKTHKYGIRVPNTVEEAILIDNENGDTLWWDTIMK